jgi:hypothetical protein
LKNKNVINVNNIIIIMASLTEQMELLQKQQVILTEKIKEEDEINKKLSHDASIERLDALILPITQHLDWFSSANGMSARQHINKSWEWKINTWNKQVEPRRQKPLKFAINVALANEEIFVTLLGIIKKQDSRIKKLEEINCNK